MFLLDPSTEKLQQKLRNREIREGKSRDSEGRGEFQGSGYRDKGMKSPVEARHSHPAEQGKAGMRAFGSAELA